MQYHAYVQLAPLFSEAYSVNLGTEGDFCKVRVTRRAFQTFSQLQAAWTTIIHGSHN